MLKEVSIMSQLMLKHTAVIATATGYLIAAIKLNMYSFNWCDWLVDVAIMKDFYVLQCRAYNKISHPAKNITKNYCMVSSSYYQKEVA